MMSKTKTFVFVLAEVAVIVGMVGYYFWGVGKTPAACELPQVKHGVITGIVYIEGSPSAVICGKIVHEGETIHDVEVVKIYKNKVELKRNKKKWTQKPQEEPNRAWPKKG